MSEESKRLRAQEIARTMPDEYPEAYAEYLAEEEDK